MPNENQPIQPIQPANQPAMPQPLRPQATIYPNAPVPLPPTPQPIVMPQFVSPKPPVATPEPAIMLPSIPMTTDEKIAQAATAPVPQTATTTLTKTSKSGKKRLIIIIASVVVLLAAATAIYFVKFRNDTSTRGPADTSKLAPSPYLPRAN